MFVPLAGACRRSTVIEADPVSGREANGKCRKIIGVEWFKLAGEIPSHHDEMPVDHIELVQQTDVVGRQVGHVQRRLVGQEWVARWRWNAGHRFASQLANNPNAELRPMIAKRLDFRRDRNERASRASGGGNLIRE